MAKSNGKALTFLSCLLFLSTNFINIGAYGSSAPRFLFSSDGLDVSSSTEIVEIIRDNWSIPHIFANSSEGVFFGLGYATAEDRMFQMEYSRRIIQGRISEMIDAGARGIESDIHWKIMGWYNVAKRLEKSLDSETKKLLRAYTDGVNEYLNTHQSSLLYLFEVYGIQPEPWTVPDCIACWYRLSKFTGTFDENEITDLYTFESLVQEVGLDQAIQQMSQPLPVDESGSIVRKEDFDPQLIVEIEQYAIDHGYASNGTGFYLSSVDVPKFSHAWVLGGNRTTTGSAILHSDPQLTITAPPIWYEFHICGGEFDVRGVGVAGAPGLLIGWNRNVSWGVTASGADEYDLFKLEINPLNLNQYYYDGAYLDMEMRQEEIVSRTGENVSITCRETVWGPVVTSLVSTARPGDEFAVKHAEVCDLNRCSLQAVIRMMKAGNWSCFTEAIENYATPVVHLIYGDRDGNIGYYFMADVPMRSRRSPLAGRIAQYGNSSTFDWQEMIPKRFLPHAYNPSIGVLSTANNMPVGKWYPLLLGVATGGTGDSVRSWRLRERLALQPSYSQEDVLAVHMDTVSPAAREIVRVGRHIVYVLGQNLSREAINTLEAVGIWNGENNASQSHYPLVAGFYLFFRKSVTSLALTYGGGEAGLCYFLKTIGSKLNVNASYVPTTEETDYIDLSLRTTWINTVNKYGTDPSQWLQRCNRTVAVSFESSLEGFGSLDPTQNFLSPELQCLNVGTILSQPGNSYSQNIRFDEVDMSKSVMPPGMSENPNSQFFDDQVPIWAAGQLHPAPLSRAEIENMVTSRVHLEWNPLNTDINDDGKVDMRDISYVARRFGIDSSHPLWDAIADLWKDDKIDMRDIGPLARDFGKTR